MDKIFYPWLNFLSMDTILSMGKIFYPWIKIFYL